MCSCNPTNAGLQLHTGRWLQIMNNLYYIHEEVGNSQQYSKPIIRILEIPIEVCTLTFSFGEGPFTSIRNLKRNSNIFKTVAKRSSKQANRLLKENNIIKIKDFILTKGKQGYPMEFINVIEHTIRGQVQKDKVYGIHYFDPTCMRIIENVKLKNDVGVWIAKIEYFDRNKNQWIQKDQETSFFPSNWNLTQLFNECFYAYQNKIKDVTKDYTYLSKTESGVKVELIIKDNQLRSIYPIY